MMKQNKMQNERTNQEETGEPNKKGMVLARGTVRSGLPALIFCRKRPGVGGRETWIPLRSQMDLMPFIR